MNYMRILLPIALFACASTATPPASPPAANQASSHEAAGVREDTDIAGLEKALAEHALVIDVRTAPEWANGHVPGAVHAPLSSIGPGVDALKGHDKSKPVYLVCQSGGRSGRAADILAKAGFHAVNVKGGTGAWKAAGKEIVVP